MPKRPQTQQFLPPPEDGKCKVMSFKDGDSTTEFNIANNWTMAVEGLYGDSAPDGEWLFGGAPVVHIGTDVGTFDAEFSGDGKLVNLSKYGDPLPSGTYHNVKFEYKVVRDPDETETLELTLPTLVVP